MQALPCRLKDKTEKSTAVSGAVTAIVGGITEPALYGSCVKYKTPLYGAMIGNFVGGALGGLLHVYAYAFAGSSGILAVTGLSDPPRPM